MNVINKVNDIVETSTCVDIYKVKSIWFGIRVQKKQVTQARPRLSTADLFASVYIGVVFTTDVCPSVKIVHQIFITFFEALMSSNRTKKSKV